MSGICCGLARAQKAPEKKEAGNSNDNGALIVTPEQRLEMARKLGAIFKQQDLEISAVAAGQGNDTIVFTSEMFQTSDGRLQFIQLYRANWEAPHCQLGFKKLVLSKGTFSSFSFGDSEYDLHCPPTAAERAAALQARTKVVADLQGDFQRGGLPVTAQLRGPDQNQLTLSSELFKGKSDRDKFFLRIKLSVESEICSQGIKTIRLQDIGQRPQYTDYKLNCVGTSP
jgi:hypothetical protein